LAAPIRLAPANGLTINLALKAANTFVVRGKVVNSVPLASSSVNFFYVVPRGPSPDHAPRLFPNSATAQEKGNGRFVIRGLSAGSYDLLPLGQDGRNQPITGRTELQITDRDMDNV